MNILLLTSIIIAIIIFLYFSYNTTESYLNPTQPYLVVNHTLSYFEQNPLVCYVSESEKNMDVQFFKQIIGNKIPYSITTNPNMRLKADLALFPEVTILDEIKNKNTGEWDNSNFPYNFMSNIADLSFSVIQLADNPDKITSFSELINSHIYIKKGGYVQELFDNLFSFMFTDKKPKITYYTNNTEATNALINYECDVIGILMHHPNSYVMKLSYQTNINIVPWELDSKLVDTFKYHFKGLQSTNISLKNYRYSDFNTELKSYGYSNSLFIKKTFPNEAAKQITNIVFQKEGIIRSKAVGGSIYIPFHNGTKEWLIEKGLISINYGNEDPSCVLLAGKSPCIGNAAKYAKLAYEREFWGSKTPNDQSAYQFILNAHKNKDDPNYSKLYNAVLENSNMCFEDMSIRYEHWCKDAGLTWDKPCVTNEECPFYKKNMNYPNDFGKCINGFCEMPLGIKRKGYTQIQENTKPICHNCPSKNPFCCRQTVNMPTPDYAFNNDRAKRLENRQELELRGIIV